MADHARKVIIYAYRLTSDSGSAPCIYDLRGSPTEILTLACCKGGQIRKGKGIHWGMRHFIGKQHQSEIADGATDVYVMGIYEKKLLYFAKLTEVLSMEDYYAPQSRYKNRHDYIYEISADPPKRNNNNPAFHPKEDTEQHMRDWLGKYALVSNCFAYFGKEAPPIPIDFLDSLSIPRSYKSFNGESPDGKRIMEFVKTTWNFRITIQNEPHDFQRDTSRKGCVKREGNSLTKRVRHR